MSDAICPFSATLAKQDFACRHADQVIRRGGTEFACRDAQAQARCSTFFDQLKQAALPALDLEDDLLQVPHGVLAKIKFGGLLGLHHLLSGDTVERIEDIDALVTRAAEHFDGIAAVPCEQLVDAITRYKLARRRRQR